MCFRMLEVVLVSDFFFNSSKLQDNNQKQLTKQNVAFRSLLFFRFLYSQLNKVCFDRVSCHC